MAPPAWLSAALEVPRAHGEPLAAGTLRAQPEDFVVDEDLGFAPDDEGPHLLLRVRKRNANTEWIAGVLARAAGVRAADVGFAGLKDRHAVTTQWFSVPARPADPQWWREFSHPGCEVLEAHPHRRKLKRGALRGNRFRVRVRNARVDAAALETRAEEIRRRGVPNYFGSQRFGRDGNNLHAAWAWAAAAGAEESSRRAGRSAGSFVLSAARSLVFNAALAERVRANTWAELQPGDVANLDGSGSIFDVPEVTDELRRRVAERDIHPTGPMWGAGEMRSTGAVRGQESAAAARFAPLPRALENAGLIQERRSLRIAVPTLQAAVAGDELELAFELPAGSFATVVIREIIAATDETRRGEGDA